LLQDTIIETLSETIEKIKRMRRDVGEFKRNVGKVVIFLESFEYDDVKDMPSYEVKKIARLQRIACSVFAKCGRFSTNWR